MGVLDSVVAAVASPSLVFRLCKMLVMTLFATLTFGVLRGEVTVTGMTARDGQGGVFDEEHFLPLCRLRRRFRPL